MSIPLDRSTSHSGERPRPSPVYFGGKGDDVFHFDIPSGEQYSGVQVEMEGRYNAGTRIEEQPPQGATGPNQQIKVHWWFDGGRDQSYIQYRIRAFTNTVPHPTLTRAILVAIENTGQVPFPPGLSAEEQNAVQRLVDAVVEIGEERNAHNLFDNFYNPVVILADTLCTENNIRDRIAQLGRDHILDLAIIGHGGEVPPGSGQAVLDLHGGTTLTEAEVRQWRTRADFQNLHLRQVYMVNCQGSKFSDAWLDLGFKTSIGTDGDDWMPEPMYSYFWTRFTNGETAQEAANKAWGDSKAIYQVVPGFGPNVTLIRINRPPWFRGQHVDNPRITASKLIVAGNTGIRFNTDV